MNEVNVEAILQIVVIVSLYLVSSVRYCRFVREPTPVQIKIRMKRRIDYEKETCIHYRVVLGSGNDLKRLRKQQHRPLLKPEPTQEIKILHCTVAILPAAAPTPCAV